MWEYIPKALDALANLAKTFELNPAGVRGIIIVTITLGISIGGVFICYHFAHPVRIL